VDLGSRALQMELMTKIIKINYKKVIIDSFAEVVAKFGFRYCSICGYRSMAKPNYIEDVACKICKCTCRAQIICRSVLTGLGYPTDSNIQRIEKDLSRVGLGISDDSMIAGALSPLFTYTNSYLHRFPIVDLCSPPPESIGYFEFISCSDVLEHTPPPRMAPLAGLFQMLKPGGFAVISVPIRRGFEFKEFYANLNHWFIENDCLYWTDSDGQKHTDHKPEFHGGEGLTLAFRQWTEVKLVDDLRAVGFSETIKMTIPPELDLDRSICVMIARKPIH
jgi:hypothetical protein